MLGGGALVLIIVLSRYLIGAIQSRKLEAEMLRAALLVSAYGVDPDELTTTGEQGRQVLGILISKLEGDDLTLSQLRQIATFLSQFPDS